jgi:ABC-2 type transport system permease protein
MDRVWQWLGIDGRQFGWLFSWFVKLSFRSGKTGKAGRSNFGMLLGIYGFISLVMGIRIMACPDPFTAFMFILTYSTVMVLFSIIMEFGSIVISPDDYLILGHLPVSEKTFWAAKLANLGYFVFLVSLVMNSISTVLLAYKFSLAALPLFFLVSVLANLFAALLIVSLYGLAIRYLPLERVRDILVYIQLGLNFLIIFGNQNLTSLAMDNLSRRSLEDYTWIKFLPSAWFAEMNLLILGKFRVDRLLLAMIPLFLGIFLLRWTIGRFSLSYAAYLQSIRESSRTFEKRPLVERLWSVFRQDPQEAAVSGLVLRYLARDREIRLRIIPLFGVLLANGFFFFSQAPGDHFGAPGHGWGSLLPVFILGWMLFMFLPSVGLGLTISEDWRASWVFWSAPLRGRTIVRGVRRALTTVIYMPLFLLFVLIFSFRFPLADVVWYVLPFIPAGMAYVTIANIFFAVPPLSQEKQTGRTTGFTLLWLFLGAIGAVLIGVLEWLCFRNLLIRIVLLAGLAAILWGSLRLEERWLDRKLLDNGYEG